MRHLAISTLALFFASAFALGLTPRTSISDPAESQSPGSQTPASQDIVSVAVATSEDANQQVQHKFTICLKDCPTEQDEITINFGSASIRIQGGLAHPTPSGHSEQPGVSVEWEEDDGICCGCFTISDVDLGNPGGAGNNAEMSASSASDQVPDGSSNKTKHGW